MAENGNNLLEAHEKAVVYQNAEADHWGSLCKGTRAIGDVDCHYVQKGYSDFELERVYTYVSTHLCSDREQTVEFGLGADDSFELWISGVSLLKKPTCQAVHKDNFVFSHTLKAGVNTILLKILDYHGENGFLLSLRKQYPGIHVSLDRNSCLQNLQDDSYTNGGHFTSAVKTAYKPPSITNLQLIDADGTSVLSEMNTIGGDRLVIQGNNFGPISDKISVNYGPSNAPFQYLAENCYVTQVDVEIQCTTAWSEWWDTP